MSTVSAPLALLWNQLCLEAIRDTALPAPQAARALAMLHTAMYDAWAAFHPRALSTTTAALGKAPESLRSRDNRRKAVSCAAYTVLKELFLLSLPAGKKNCFRELMHEQGYDPDNTVLDHTSAQGIGNLAAQATLSDRSGDGSNAYGVLGMPAWSDYTNYRPVNTPGLLKDSNRWQPQYRPDNGQPEAFLVPHWSLVRPFALQGAGAFRPGTPACYEYGDAAIQELLELSAGLDDEQKCIAEYWNGGTETNTSPGQWCEIAQFIATRDAYTSSQCIRLFFLLGNALLDASIACWDSKRRYDAARPVSVVRTLYKDIDIQAWGGPGRGTRTIKGREWQSYANTLPCPGYVSEQAAFAWAAAAVLEHFSGSGALGGCSTIGKGSSLIEPGLTPAKDLVLDWPDFETAAAQAAQAALYAGTHFRQDIEAGKTLGEAVAKACIEKARHYFNEQPAAAPGTSTDES